MKFSIIIPTAFAKICSRCKIEKSRNNFWKSKRSKDSLCPWCKECYLVERRPRNKKYNEKYKELNKERALKRRYGLTQDQYNQMVTNQNNCCLICNEGQINKKLNVDHKHDITKKVRGLLCNKCNRALGYFDDNLQKVKAAVSYLERYD